MAQYLSFDLSLIRNFDYYTGMVFEAYAPQIGSTSAAAAGTTI